MFDFYLTTLPRDAVIGSVALIAGVACAFALFDLLSRRRFNVLVRDTAAAQADGAAAQERMRARHGFVSMVSVRNPPLASPRIISVVAGQQNPKISGAPLPRPFLSSRLTSSHLVSPLHSSLRPRPRLASAPALQHEIRSPASAIVGALDLLQSTALSPPQLDFVVRLTQNAPGDTQRYPETPRDTQ